MSGAAMVSPASPIGARPDADLLALIGRDTRLRKAASTRGGEWAGACPFCGGVDRLRVQPERGLWWCRHCSDGDRWQDAIAYIRRRDNCSFFEACVRLGTDPDERERRVLAVRLTSAPPAPAPEPSAAWQAAALAFSIRCIEMLQKEAGERARAYLHGRGLRDEAIRAWRLGLNPADEYAPAEEWGLDPADAGQHGRVWLPKGITLPWIVGQQLWAVKIRRPVGEPKYLGVKGGHPIIYGAHTLAGKPVALACEGEFDCMLAHQEAGDLVGTFTLGSASKGVDARALPFLLPLRRILACYDRDDAGAKGAARLAAMSARVRIAQVPHGHKDLTEYHQRGGDVRAWVQALVAEHAPAAGPVTVSKLVAALYARGVGYWVGADGELQLADPLHALDARLQPALEQHREALAFIARGTPIAGRPLTEAEQAARAAAMAVWEPTGSPPASSPERQNGLAPGPATTDRPDDTYWSALMADTPPRGAEEIERSEELSPWH